MAGALAFAPPEKLALATEIRGRVQIKRSYVDCRHGQLHLHTAMPLDPADIRYSPLICLTPSPASGWYFRDFIADMGQDRIAMAADTPGFGESDRPRVMPEHMSEFSGAIADCLEALEYGAQLKGSKVDILGYKTGAVIALDLATSRLDLIRKVCLMSPPYFDDDKVRQQRLDALLYPPPYSEAGTRVLKTWESAVRRRGEGVTLEQGIKIFQERLRAGDKDWWAYKAVYTYPFKEKYAELAQPTAILNPHGTSYEGTLRAAKNKPQAKLIDLPQLGNSPFSVNPDVVAREVRSFLDA